MFVSLEPEDRRELLRSVAERFGLRVLIETGTNQGLTPLALRDSFDVIYTIELHPALYKQAKAKLARYGNVCCVQGDSATVLPRILADLSRPALVWLDGHYSGDGTAHGPRSTPIREELTALLGADVQHVILIDDARIFEGGPEHDLYDHYADYPSLKWVEDTAEQYGYSFELDTDIMRLVPRAFL